MSNFSLAVNVKDRIITTTSTISLEKNFNSNDTWNKTHVPLGLNVFLVAAFSLKEKSPTITVGSFLVGAFPLRKKARLLQ